MGQQAIYTLYENGENNYFFAHWGANALSPLMKLAQAKEMQEETGKTINHIFEHLDYNAGYQNPKLDDADMFFSKMDLLEANDLLKEFNTKGLIEMHITLDLDSNECVLAYNRNCPWFATMDNYSIPVDVGLENIRKLTEYADKKGIDSFGELLQVYTKATGLDIPLANARASEKIENYTQSPQAEEQRQRLREMTQQNEEFEMEE